MNASGLRVQKQASQPGEQYAALVSAAWVPPSVVFLVASRYGAFAVMSPELSQTIERAELGAVTGAYRVGAAVADAVNVTTMVFAEDGAVGVGEPTRAAPAESPPGWLEAASATLMDHDDAVRRRIRAQLQRTEAARERAAVKLLAQCQRPVGERAPAVESLTLRVWGQQGDSRVLLKADRDIIGRLYLSSHVLATDNQDARHAAAMLLEANGHHVLPPLRGWDSSPTASARVDGLGGGRELTVRLLPEQMHLEPAVAGVLFPNGQLMCAANAWLDTVTEVLEWHGLEVSELIGFEAPHGYRPDLYHKLYPDLPPPPSGGSRLPKSYTVDRTDFDPADLVRVLPRRRPRRKLTPESRRLVPRLVAAGVEACLRGSGPSRFEESHSAHKWWGHRSGVWTAWQLGAISEAIAPTPLPPSAAAAVTWAAGISQIHAPVLASIRLRTVDPAWWGDLPWVDGPRRRRGSGGSRPGHQLHQQFLAEMSSAQLASCGQPGLKDLLTDRSRRRALTEPDLPVAFSQDDRGRLLVATSALIHAGLLDMEPDTPQTGRCVTCGRLFLFDSLFIRSLLFTGSVKYCAECVEDALAGSMSPWTETRSRGALESIRQLAAATGGPPAREMLTAPLTGLPADEVTRQLLLRICLPRPGSDEGPRWSWTEWLEKSGVMTDGWRPSYGLYSTAEDGHPCRSLLERYIDDYFFSRGMPHEVEPSYPYDSELNPNGRRADWLVAGVYVEAAGMAGAPTYDAKMLAKRDLADRHGLELIVIRPSDVADLDAVLGHLKSHHDNPEVQR
ncbi:hypothetical protein [Phycicoccus sp. Soil803]|uniref:hypothetical protein n=1 Tax=Phycicoccus sp. Soil803 TaxID=1736415 RepID=UPI00070FF409|nr:hypothetical protein [Phycicoccus sp. Soil803]KRF24779.1 hypothetical protein ASG95_09875 [Phycicoccus sp. Soil803]